MTLEDYLYTLEICRRALPEDAHPIHRQRLDEIEQILRRALVEETAQPFDDDERSGWLNMSSGEEIP